MPQGPRTRLTLHAVAGQVDRWVRHRAAQAEELGVADATELAWLFAKGKSGATRSAQKPNTVPLVSVSEKQWRRDAAEPKQ
jgi:hypothetical protein